MNIYTSTEELIGKTPLLELTRMEKKYNLSAKLFAKLEFFNPTGSAKDRAAKYMIEEGEKAGKIGKNTVIIEPTSGNTGIGLASVCATKGYRLIIVMPDTMSQERRLFMSLYGAELVLSDGTKGMKGAIAEAERLAREIPDSFIPDQFNNPANALSHYETTGPEIYRDLDGKVDIFVAGIGTGGTITGVGKYLKERNKETKIIAVEPQTSPFLTEGKAGSHKIQGIGAGFVPSVLDRSLLDEILLCDNEKCFESVRLLGKEEGILVGISSGAVLFGALEMAKRAENKGKNIVVLFPDSGDRYLSVLGE